MKKRIFIAIHYLEIGGAEISLIGLLQALDYSKYDVDLFIYSHRGELMEYIPEEVNLLPEIPEYAQIERPMKDVLKDGFLRIVLRRLWAKRRFARYKNRKNPIDGGAVFGYVFDSVTPVLPSLEYLGEYDLAISFLAPHFIVADKVLAKKKAAWIHTDYSFLELDTKVELPIWSAFDKIVSISEDVSKGFLLKFPSLKNKILLMENILSEQFVREQANMPIDNSQLTIHNLDKTLNSKHLTLNLLSVGRYSYPKAFDRAVHICKRLVDKGLNIRWFIIGFGGEETSIRKAIAETGMSERFILLGKKINPYPYIKACDVYIQPSRYEGKAVTVREAQILCKPVVITNYATAPSQVQDGIDGIIVPNDVEGAAEGIAVFLQDKQKQQQLVTYLQTHHYGNEEEIKKIDFYV